MVSGPINVVKLNIAKAYCRTIGSGHPGWETVTEGKAETKIDSFSSKVSINLVVTIIRTVVMAVVGFMMVPFYIGQFGMSVYAIIPLVTTIALYFTVVSDALANVFTRYMAIEVQKGDMQAVNVTFSSSMLGLGRVLMLLIPLCALMSYVAPYVFNIGEADALEVQVLFFTVLLSIILISCSASLESVFMAYNKLYIMYAIRTLQTLVQAGLAIVFLLGYGPSLILLGFSYLISSIVFLVLLIYYVRKVCPELKLSRKFYDKALLSRMMTLGGWTTFSEIFILMYIQSSLILVNLYLGSETQGVFSIVVNILSMIGTTCSALFMASVPLIYRYYAAGDRENLIHTLVIFTKFVGLMMAFPIAYLMVFSSQVIQVWLGQQYEGLIDMMYVVLPLEIAVCSARTLMEVPMAYLRMRVAAIYTAIFGVFNIVGAIIVLQFTDYGAMGVCVVWVIAMAMLKLVFYPTFAARLTGTGLWTYYKPEVICYAAFGVLLALGFVFDHFVTMPASWIPLILVAFFGLVVYMGAALSFGFDKEEKKILFTFLPGIVQRMIINRG